MKEIFVASLSGIVFILWVLPPIKIHLLIQAAQNRYCPHFNAWRAALLPPA